MTNKLPVVGKRYRATEANEFIPNKNYIMRCDEILSDRVILNKDTHGAHIGYPIEVFFKYFEELPQDNSQETEEKPTTKKNLQVERALEELRYSLLLKEKHEFKGHVFFDGYKEHWKPLLNLLNGIEDAAQNLINTLEAEKNMSKEEPKIDIKKERVEPLSIWKNGDELKELDKRNEQFLVRLKDGRVIKPILSNILTDNKQSNKNIKEATTLTDFINSFEQMQKDIEELKQKLGNV